MIKIYVIVNAKNLILHIKKIPKEMSMQALRAPTILCIKNDSEMIGLM